MAENSADAIAERDATIIRLTCERDEARADRTKLRGLMWFAWSEFNAIRARSGAPLSYDGMTTVDEAWWSQLTDAFSAAIGDDAKPWLSPSAHAALKEIGNG